MRYGIRVKDIMARKPLSVMEDDSLCKVAKVLTDSKRGAVTVLDHSGNLVGIVTATDLVTKALSKRKNPEKTIVKDIMSSKILSFSPEDDISFVANKMNEKGVRRAPVLDEQKRVVGYISERDLLSIQPRLLDLLMEKLRLREPSLKLRYRVV
jgi:CBS domain-containing protein